MSIKYAVLGLIAEEPRHGYAVRAAFEERLGDFWQLNYGQVYQVLGILESQGFIVSRDEQIARRPTRRVYSISAKGRASLQRWLEHPRVTTAKPFRDDFYARLLFIKQHDGDVLARLLKAQKEACEQRPAELLDQRRQQERTTPEKTARWLFTEAAIMRAEAEFKAAALCQDVLAGVTGVAIDASAPPQEKERLRQGRNGSSA